MKDLSNVIWANIKNKHLTQDKNILISVCCLKPVLWNCKTDNEEPLGICTKCHEWSETISVTNKLFKQR